MGSFEFTATLFDLIRRGHYTAAPRQPRSARRGRGCAASRWPTSVTSARARRTANRSRTSERPIVKVVDDVLSSGTEHLSSFRDRISDDRKKNSERFSAFKSTVKDAIEGRGWFQDAGARTLAIAAALFLIPGAIAVWQGIHGFQPVRPRWSDILLIALGLCACISEAIRSARS